MTTLTTPPGEARAAVPSHEAGVLPTLTWRGRLAGACGAVAISGAVVYLGQLLLSVGAPA